MEFKIGDKVKIPKTKQGKVSNFYSSVLEAANKKKQDYLYYNGISGWASEYVLNDTFDPDNLTGDFFNLNEIELYEEEFPKVWCLKITKESFLYIQKAYTDFEILTFDTCFNHDYLKSDHSFAHRSIETPSKEYPELTLDHFKNHIFKESTIMKNLLETEFVIENCTLSQRLAIKAYCDEKNIKYASKYTFEDKVFNALVWDKTEFLNYDTDRKDKRDRVTFSELIQFLDNYQPEPEFKVGDFVYFEGKHHQAGPYLLKEKISDGAFEDSNNETRDIKESRGAYRHATPEEIKKWKEENEIKLPRINQYDGKVDRDFIIYGNNCAKLKISWFKNIGNVSSFLNIGENRTIRSIKLNSDVEITIAHIEQIKKFIEHNKL